MNNIVQKIANFYYSFQYLFYSSYNKATQQYFLDNFLILDNIAVIAKYDL